MLFTQKYTYTVRSRNRLGYQVQNPKATTEAIEAAAKARFEADLQKALGWLAQIESNEVTK